MDGDGARRKGLVGATADHLRELVYAAGPGVLIGAPQDLAASLQVGLITIRQAARVLEHEGLIEARRGPGGGYYGTRPDAAALSRSMNAFLRSNPSTYDEALNITSLLFTELACAAAGCRDAALRSELEALMGKLDKLVSRYDCGWFEENLLDLLCRMVGWPLFKMLLLVTLRAIAAEEDRPLLVTPEVLAEWSAGRGRIITAILQNDSNLARFEADRSNRQPILAWMNGRTTATSPPIAAQARHAEPAVPSDAH